MIGIGDKHSRLQVYIKNRPDFADLLQLQTVRPVEAQELKNIGDKCGNGWRKVFNVYAKFLFALKAEMHAGIADYASWQEWRDQILLRENSNSLLLFSKPSVSRMDRDKVHLVMGKGWANECDFAQGVYWLNSDFALLDKHNLIVCPYFDYRQLSNQKIVYLCELLQPMLNKLDQ